METWKNELTFAADGADVSGVGAVAVEAVPAFGASAFVHAPAGSTLSWHGVTVGTHVTDAALMRQRGDVHRALVYLGDKRKTNSRIRDKVVSNGGV